ncbi:MAG: 4Fe-4S ferredoxin [Verrucomicrobia bacterium]|nr:MAG: 4Fe-4S ferredoxin [Verrucomicrobiota bacterium]
MGAVKFRDVMDWPLIIGVIAFLSVVFTVLGFWHRSIQEKEDQRLARAIKDSEAQGSNQALTQHPQIDINQCIGCGSCVQACPEHGVLALVEGKARLVNAAHCVGHGCCETACPVGALVVGLGDISSRSDIPVLSNERETSVPGIFIAGELGGIGLIRHAIAQGKEVAETIHSRLKGDDLSVGGDDPLDVLIVGCGPSGISASLRAHELGLNFSIIEQDGIGGSVRKYPRSKMTLTQPVDLPVYGRMKRTQYVKEELIELWENVLGESGIDVQSGVKLTGLEHRADGTLIASTSAGIIPCRNCILSLGRRGTPRRLGVPGEDSEKVLYQLVDAADYTHQNLLVVGGGDSAIEAALALAAQPGNRVILSYRRHAFFRIKARNRERIEAAQQEGRIEVLFNSQVEHFESGQALLILNSSEGGRVGERQVSADSVFVFAGGEPPYPLLKSIGVHFGGEVEKLREAG